ncbi:MAG: 2-hydroxyacyl-CoA dehydratase family protein [Atribacterota bacterium]|nr:2-hydroxyacyl-CoA dehydratase family protein [Atribacterota bacterium]
MGNIINSDLKDRIIISLAQSSFTYKLIRKVGSYYFRKSDSSFLFWLNFYTRQLEIAYQQKKPVVWASIFTPSELLYALDLIPLYPEMISASVASLNLADYFIETAESNFYSPDLCSFYRVASGMSLKNCLPRPDMVISTSLLCDGSVKFFQNVSRYYGCDYYLIDPPYERNQGSRKYLVNELKKLVQWVSKRTNEQFSSIKLRKALELANQSTLLIKKINQIREKVPAPLSGWNALAYQLYMYFASLGSRDGLNFYELLAREVKNNAIQDKGVVERECIRILWLHQLRPYYPNIIWQIMLDYKAVIAFEEINQVFWLEYDLTQPFSGLADKILANPGAGSLSRRISSIENLIKKYKIDGVIHFNQRGCRQSCGGASMIKDYLKAKGIPIFILDGDGIDKRNYSEGQTRTRLEAFFEILSQNR